MNTNNGWLDIASAPKDGTEILAWRSDCGQFIASYTSADSFPMTQDELDAWDDETLFSKDWFTQWPHALRLEGSEAPTLWQPLAADPCATCNDQGAVGNILTAQPCPDCTPPASAQDSTEARTGNTAAEQAAYWRGFEEAQLNAQHNARVRDAASTVADEGVKEYGSPARILRQFLTVDGFIAECDIPEICARLRPAAPAAGDARAWQRLTDAERDGYVGELVDYGTDFVAPLYSVVESIEKRLREKNAASQQGGE
jgi:hypothetical protein